MAAPNLYVSVRKSRGDVMLLTEMVVHPADDRIREWRDNFVHKLSVLAMLVFAVQYFVLFAVAAAIPPLIVIAMDFLAGPRHRSELMGPRR